jgi:Na+/proline symporter
MAYEKFFAANRNVGLLVGGLTVCASWLWGIALLVSSQQAFVGGIAQFLWFAVPNALALLLFAFLTIRIQKVMPNGYTVMDVIDNGERVSPKSLTLSFWGITLLTEVYSFTVQLTAATLLFSFLFSTVPAWVVASNLAGLMYITVRWGGLNVITKYADLFKMGLILILLGAIGYSFYDLSTMALTENPMANALNFGDLFNWHPAIDFGLPISISLLSGVVIGNQVWQRNTALSPKNVQSSFILGACIWWVVVFGLGMLGLLASGIFLDVWNTQLVGVFTLSRFLPNLTIGLVSAFIGVLVVSGASALSSFASLIAADVSHGIETKISAILLGRISIFVVGIVGYFLTLLQIPLVTMLQFLGVRAAFFIPFLIILYSKPDTKFTFDLTLAIWFGILVYMILFFGTDLKAFAGLAALLLPGYVFLNKSLIAERST